VIFDQQEQRTTVDKTSIKGRNEKNCPRVLNSWNDGEKHLLTQPDIHLFLLCPSLESGSNFTDSPLVSGSYSYPSCREIIFQVHPFANDITFSPPRILLSFVLHTQAENKGDEEIEFKCSQKERKESSSLT